VAGHICPWWLGYLHLGPIRRRLQNPLRILSPCVRRGMRVLDIGPGMGFFTLDMARLVGREGMVYAIDVQQKMIDVLVRRAKRAGLADRITARVCEAGSLGAEDLRGSIDCALGFHVVHEVPDARALFSEVHGLLVPGGRFLVVEPMKRVSPEDFERMIATAREVGFALAGSPEIGKSQSALLARA
jgi:ubiquinone/menaquinone biosynthesis C-methylase UbiE